MEFKIELEVDEWLLFQKHLHKELTNKNRSVINVIFNLIFWSFILVVFLAVIHANSAFHWSTIVVATLFYGVCILIFIYDQHLVKKAAAPEKGGVFLGEHNYIFNDEGIRSSGVNHECFFGWPVVQRVERSRGLILVFLDTSNAYIFPESKLDNPDEFYRYLTGKIE